MEHLFSHIGVRVFIMDSQNRLLLVRHYHQEEDSEFWILPGGGLEENEYSWDAAIREVKEETNLDINVISLLYTLEEKTEHGLRCTNYFLGEVTGGDLCLGEDPEFDNDHQVLNDVKYFTKEDIQSLPRVWPEVITEEFWNIIEDYLPKYKIWRKRPSKGFTK
jgi:ADP-ribose pyrophosphatase YjhB (NUDIX family)